MRGDPPAFFSVPVTTCVVRRGANERLIDNVTGASRHFLAPVYAEMLAQITLDCPGLPDARALTASQIRFFFDRCSRGALLEHTKPQDPSRKK